jgi:uncharacterized protein YndB with AHSA1/START domain
MTPPTCERPASRPREAAMETTADTTSVERELAIDASPETVWEFLVDPEKATRWMGSAAVLDARPGGEYRVDVIDGHVASGEFVEVDRPRRVVYTFGWEPEGGEANPVPPGSTTIEITLTPRDRGTMLRFRHYDLPTGAAAEAHGHGWDHYLARLTVAAAGGDPGPDRGPGGM